jgi:methylmalonyl-CoA mutase N-terminal domain/subunit
LGPAQAQVANAAYRWRQEVESGARTIVGVNRFLADEDEPEHVFRPDPDAPHLAVEDLRRHREQRDEGACKRALADLRATARAVTEGTDIGSTTAALVAAADADATLGEMQSVLFEVFGRNK